jgi:hypothetical protein
MRILLSALAAAILVVSPAAAERVRPLGHASPGGGYSGDVFVHGGFAYLSSWHGVSCPAQGVRVYDLSRPSHPRRIATFAAGAADLALRGTWTEKTIVQHTATPSFTGELAVTSFQNCPGTNSFRGFGLYDVSDPHAPRELSLVRTDPGGSHEIWLQPKGRRAYVYTAIPLAEFPGHAPTPGFRIYDVTDPRHPQEVGSWMVPDALRTGKQAFVHSVRVNPSATRAFLSYWDAGTVILDISRPSQPRFLGRTTPSQPAAHSTALSRDGRLLIETHETTGGRPWLWDISNPRRPKLLSIFRPPARLIAEARKRTGAGGFELGVHDPKVLGHRLYFSWYALGVLVADISNPRRPRLVAQFLPPASRDAGGDLCGARRCSMTWGVYPTKAYSVASDMVGGLWVFRVR